MFIIIAIVSIFSFTTALLNRPMNPENIDAEIRQEYVNSYKLGGYYYDKALEQAKDDAGIEDK
jgi:uncharacterized protein (DUF2164 family)